MSKRIRRFASSGHRRTVFIFAGIITACIIGAAVYFFIIRENPEAALYRYKAAELESRIEKGTRTVYVAADYIPQGTVIERSMVMETQLLTESDGYITDEDFGGVAMTDIKAGTELTKSLFGYTLSSPVQKEVEYEIGYIPGNITIGDYVDIRIRFPDGTDYIVLSKKQIRESDIHQNKLLFYVDEREILLMDSAVVDASIYDGTSLYPAKYADPASEPASTVNYIPSLVTCELMKSIPEAVPFFSAFDYEKRVKMEDSLKSFLNAGGQKVSSGRDTSSYDKGGSAWD